MDIIAVSARTPVGLSAEISAATVRAAISRFNEYPFISVRGEPLVVAADPQLAPDLEIRERLWAMLNGVLDEIRRKLDRGARYDGPCYLLLALPETRPGFPDLDAEWIVNALQTRRPPIGTQMHVELAGRGHAGAIQAVERAVQECSGGMDALFLVAGADSYHNPDTIMWLEQHLQFAQPTVRNGFVPGEAAGCVVLASNKKRQSSLGLTALAVVKGVSTAKEVLLRDSETGSLGIGMSQAVRNATKALRLPQDGVDTLYSDINGERYRSEEWGFVAMRTPYLWKSLTYEAPSDCWGDVGAAFPPLAAALAVQSYARNYARGPRALVMAGSESGLRGALLIQDPKVNE
jgi:3-oxoacyl-[acyl-carrier-protein] synthase-1